MIDLTLLVDGGISWIDASGPASPLVLSTRIRLARNLAGRPFATRNSPEDREAIADAVAGAVAGTEALGRAASFRLDRLDLRDRPKARAKLIDRMYHLDDLDPRWLVPIGPALHSARRWRPS